MLPRCRRTPRSRDLVADPLRGLGSYSPSGHDRRQHPGRRPGFRRLSMRHSSAMAALDGVSEIFDPEAWDDVPGFEDLTDLTYHRAKAHGTVRVAFDRPDVLNAFRPHTVDELLRVLEHARTSSDVGCVLLTGNGPSAKNGKWAFCTGGDQRIRGRDRLPVRARARPPETVDKARLGRLHILECQRLIRFMPKIVICVVPGWTAGGGHSLHVVCDLTLASARGGAVQADRRRRRLLRRRLRVGVPRPPGRPEVRPRDLLPRPGVLRRGRRPDGRRQPRGAARRARGHRARVGPAGQRQVARPRSGC